MINKSRRSYEVSPKRSDYICIHSIFGNSSYASFFGCVFVHFGRTLSKKYVKHRAVFPFNSHHLKRPVDPAVSSYTGVLLWWYHRGAVQFAWHLTSEKCRGKKGAMPQLWRAELLYSMKWRQFRNYQGSYGSVSFLFWSRQTGTIYPLLSTMIRRFFQTAAGMCKNPGGRTSTTRTYHSLGAMLPSNWSIVDPM